MIVVRPSLIIIDLNSIPEMNWTRSGIDEVNDFLMRSLLPEMGACCDAVGKSIDFLVGEGLSIDVLHQLLLRYAW